MLRTHSFVVIAVALAAAPGCALLNSFSDSSGSVSSISESVSDSSASSSGGDSAWHRIENDVKQYTARAVRPNVDVDEYLRGVAAVCERQGVTNWEEHDAVYRGMGAGLAATSLDEAHALRFAGAVTGWDDARVAMVREAFAAARP